MSEERQLNVETFGQTGARTGRGRGRRRRRGSGRGPQEQREVQTANA